MRVPRRVIVLFALIAAIGLVRQNTLAAGTLSPSDGLADGPGIWVNMWHYPEGDVDAYCQSLHAKGIRNIFIQTSRSNTEAICHKEQLGVLIDACHRYKIRVIAWSFGELFNPVADADKLVAAARFQSPHGQHIDAVAANLEKDLSANKVEAYSKHLRAELGAGFPMVAVVYSPLNKAPQVARIPWKMLGEYYDVIAPMNYWNSRYQAQDPYNYTLSTIKQVRELVGRPDVEIHVIGDGMGTHAPAIEQFFKACQTGNATSASIYPNHLMTDEQMEAISKYSDYFPVNSRFRLAAYRTLIKNGNLDARDPSQAISRGDFYRLVVKQLNLAPADGSNVTSDRAAEVLHGLGALASARVYIPRDMTPEDALNASIGPKEAFNVVAAVVNFKPGSKSLVKTASTKRARPDRWFVQPAFAERGVSDTEGDNKKVSYLDAAQIVLQATQP